MTDLSLEVQPAKEMCNKFNFLYILVYETVIQTH